MLNIVVSDPWGVPILLGRINGSTHGAEKNSVHIPDTEADLAKAESIIKGLGIGFSWDDFEDERSAC